MGEWWWMREHDMFSIVVPTLNRAHVSSLSVESLLAQAASVPYEIVVVDNDSADDTRVRIQALAEKAAGRLRYILGQQPGCSAARNAGIAAARGGIIAFIDDDAIAGPGWLEALARTYRAYPDAWCVGGKILLKLPGVLPRWFDPRSVTMRAHLSGFDLGDAVVKRHYPHDVWGANFSVRRSALERVGLFDPSLGRVARRAVLGDETDLCWRIQEAGGGVYYCGEAVVTHLVPEARLTKRYFRTRAYWLGRTWRLLDRKDVHMVRPAQLVRSALRAIVNWVTSWRTDGPAESRGAFERETQFWLYLGYFVQQVCMTVARHPSPRASRPPAARLASSPDDRASRDG